MKKNPNEEKNSSAETLLKLSGFGMAFDENVLFSNFECELRPGIYVLSGQSGCGKSTLMRCIAGLENGYTGDITLNGVKLQGTSKAIHMLHQHYYSFPWLNALKNVMMVFLGHCIRPSHDDYEEAKAVLMELGLGEHMNKLPRQLSGGQDQRLSFANAFVNRWSKVFLYDEPTSALDDANDMILVELIKRHQRENGTIEIIITHEKHVIEGLGATVLELTPEFTRRQPKVVETPAAEEQMVEAPAAEEQMVVEPAAEEQIVEAPAAEEQMVVEPAAEEQMVVEPDAEVVNIAGQEGNVHVENKDSESRLPMWLRKLLSKWR